MVQLVRMLGKTAIQTISVHTEKGEPMLTDENTNIMEQCFRNGEQHMKDKIISKFQSVAESMTCITLAQAIKMVEDL